MSSVIDENVIKTRRSRNWMRCFVVLDKEKKCIAQGVVFRDDSVIVRGTNGQTSIYPNSSEYEKTLAPENWVQSRDVDDWIGIVGAADNEPTL